MPRRPSPAIRTTLYRLTGVDPLPRAVRPKYLEADTFRQHPLTIGPTEALLVAGQMLTERAKWTERVQHLTGTDLNIGNATAAGLLLIRDPADPDVVWALSYGMGFQLLEQRYIDAGFGHRTALRAADPKAVRSLTRTTLDHRSRTDRSSIPNGDQLRTFDVGGFGELVTRLVASARIPELTHDQDSLTLRAADSLSVPLGRTANTLLADLATIRGVLLRPPLPDFALLEQLVPVKAERLLVRLNESLRATLAGEEDNGRLALA